jgi:hypothetical protein
MGLGINMDESYPQLYKKIRGGDIDIRDVLEEFVALPLPDPTNPITAAEPADRFFAEYGVGNTLDLIDRPYERMHAYEMLLYLLFERDSIRFQAIHNPTTSSTLTH